MGGCGLRMRRAVAGIIWSIAMSWTAPALAQDPGDGALSLLRARLGAEARESAGHVGVAAIDLASGRAVSVNGGERFPMASTVKVAIAAVFLQGVESGRTGLDRLYARPLGGGRGRGRRGAPASLTGAVLLERMLTVSDNNAADILLSAIGGTQAVDRWLRTADVVGQRVDRSIAQLLSDRETRTRLRVGHGRHRRWVTVRVPRADRAGDTRDSSTPEAMAALLAKLRDGQLLDPARTAYLFDVMARCRTGPRRIRGMLPPGTAVAHKTGTLDGVTDDVGIVDLPDGHRLAVAVFVHGRGGPAAHDRTIARVARLLYDGFGGLPADDGGIRRMGRIL